MRRLLANSLLLIACGGNSQNTDGAPVDASSMQIETLTDYYRLECPWQSKCRGTTLEQCFSWEDDEPVFIESFRKRALDARADCLRTVTSCAEYSACQPTERAMVAPTNQQCPGGQELVCDSQRNEFWWCLDTTANVPPVQVVDLTSEGMICSADGMIPIDSPAVDCSGAPPRACEGDNTVLCRDPGFQKSTFSCKAFDKDFTCAPKGNTDTQCIMDGVQCTHDGKCIDATKAEYCFYGKPFVIDCGQVGGTCDAAGQPVRCL